MSSAPPTSRSIERPAESFADRVQYCRALLHIHGFITEAENKDVKRRIDNWERDAPQVTGDK